VWPAVAVKTLSFEPMKRQEAQDRMAVIRRRFAARQTVCRLLGSNSQPGAPMRWRGVNHLRLSIRPACIKREHGPGLGASYGRDHHDELHPCKGSNACRFSPSRL
jgi:hypothetical protein